MRSKAEWEEMRANFTDAISMLSNSRRAQAWEYVKALEEQIEAMREAQP